MEEEILLKIEVDSGANEKKVDDLTKSIVELQTANKNLNEENKKLAKSGQENTKAYIDNAKQIEINKQKITENTASRKGLIQAIVAEDNSVKRLKVQNAELIRQRDQINSGTEAGRAKIQELNKAIDANNEQIKENSSALEQQKQNVGNYTDSINESVPALNAATGAIESMVNPITAVVAAGTALVAFYARSTQGARDLARAQDQLSYATQFVADSFADFVGADGSGGFFQNALNALISYFDPAVAAISYAGAQAKERLRDIEISVAFAQEFAKDSERQAEINRRIRDDETQSYQTRLKAIQDINSELESSRDRTVTVLQAQIEAIKSSTVRYDLNREAQLRVAQIEAEIADKREEITGKLTENVMAQYALEKELREKRIAEEDEEAAAYFQRIENRLAADLAALERRKEFEEEFYGEDGQIDKIHKDFNKRLIKETQDRNKKQIEDEQKTQRAQEKIEALKTQAVIGGLELVTKERSVARLAGNAIFKQDAIKETFINTRAAATAAYKALAGIPIVGPALGAIAAGLAVAFGLTQVAAITGVQFRRGGLLARGGIAANGGVLNGPSHAHGGIPFAVGGRVGFEAEGGEAIINKRSTAMYKPLLSKINEAGGGVPFATGGVTGEQTRISAINAQAQFDINQMANLLNQVQTVLVLEDFETKQSEVTGIKRRAQVIG